MTIFGLLHLLMDAERAGSAEDVAILKRILGEIEGMEANLRDELSRESAVTRQRRLRVRISFLRNQRLKGLRFLRQVEGRPPIAGSGLELSVAAATGI